MHLNQCLLFAAGLYLTFAFDNLSYNKLATQSLTYIAQSSGASNAVDGNTTTCMKQFAIGLNAAFKTVWWNVDLGDVYPIYSISILFKTYDGFENRQRGRFAGFSLYVSTTGDIQGSTLCYKDGPQLPPLEFTTTCIQHGRYVIFYNERKDDITYPMDYQITSLFNELCEVVVLGCNKTGVYGMDCNKLCPINCQNNLCNIENGSCFGCKPGWRDIVCDKECIEGRYGSKCLQQCSGHCRDSVTCNRVTGQCDGGCDKGWTGAMCDKACAEGYFGANCSRKCSPHCKPDTCRHADGSCTCTAGWMGNNCTTECMLSYGDNCQYRCNVHCINQTCDRINGSCLYGCMEGNQCYGSLDTAKNAQLLIASSDKLPVIVGGTVGTCVIVIIGVVLALFVIRFYRQRSSRTMSNTCVHRVCCKFAPAEESVNSANLSNYQELNFALQENPYQSMSR